MASITDAIDFANFDEQNDTNGSGIDTSDTFNNWRRKTNGIINELKNISVFAKANILISNPGVVSEPFALSANSYNVSTLTYIDEADGSTITGLNAAGAIRVNFTTAATTSDYLVFLQLNKQGADPVVRAATPNGALRSSVSSFNQTADGLTVSAHTGSFFSRLHSTDDASLKSNSLFDSYWLSSNFTSISLLVFT